MEGEFVFEGRSVPFRPGQTLAAALTAAGARAFRETASGGTRGVFCGMGVCQDCLLSVDGAPNHRACMTPATAGAVVARQPAHPALDPKAEVATPPDALILAPDVAILGGGAAGLSAAIAAAEAGADVVLLDERKVGGGQYYKQPAEQPMLDAQQAEGAALLRAASQSGARILTGVETWGAFDGPVLMAQADGRAVILRPKAVIMATGAYERPIMVPGWTHPGVMTTGAAQTLWRSYRALPGARVLVCGSGPLNVQVAVELAEGGADIAAVAETAPAPWARPGAALAMMRADPALARKGLGLMARLRKAGAAVRYGTRLTRVDAVDGGLRATLAEKGGGTHQVEVDAICMNDGFLPQNEVLRLLGAEMRFDAAYGHLRCARGPDMATSVAGIFAAGDCAGLGGAPAARVEGRIAGRAAARFAGHGGADTTGASETAELAKHRRFQDALWRLYDPGPQALDDMPGETIICRCEEITLDRARASIGTDAGHAGTLKRATRIGMGRCQGRYCGPVAARLVAEANGTPLDDRSFYAPRVPVKPVAISAILAAQEALDGDA
ncbi:FAD-dependent oxidoreductase [uncultured Jannaschia sp.]|uniref:FAD-dependent oxidoreductase n=1 Tax=uncultured Jannaschia sp. TaxID=293347 RepID=UPI002610F2D4|nr:FAD-dependent oxidoreductase [uncultured Jannaschia sp.]